MAAGAVISGRTCRNQRGRLGAIFDIVAQGAVVTAYAHRPDGADTLEVHPGTQSCEFRRRKLLNLLFDAG